MSTLTEKEMRDALRPVRPDAGAFRRAIEEKLAARKSADAKHRRPLGGVWRQAAGVLPLDLLTLPVGGAYATGVTKPIVAKGLVSVAVLPVVALAMLFVTFLGTLRAIIRVRPRPETDRAAEKQALRAWWKTHTPHVVGTIIVLGGVALTQPVEAIVAILLVSMIVVTHLVLRLSRADAASRESVGRLTSGFLATLLLVGLFFGGALPAERVETLPDFYTPLIVLLGYVACTMLESWKRGWSRTRKGLTVLVTCGAAALSISVLDARVRPVTDSQLASFVRDFDRPLSDTVDWRRLGVVGEWLEENGARRTAIERERLRGVVADGWRARVDSDRLFGSSFPSVSILGAARLDLLPESIWDAIREQQEERPWIDGTGPLSHPEAIELELRARLRDPMEPSLRDRLARRLRAGWAAANDARALESMAASSELLELLGRPVTDAEITERVHAALEASWHGRSTSSPFATAFVSYPARLDDEAVADLLRLDSTHGAVQLMARFGVPSGIDLVRVEAFLRRAATPTLVEALSPPSIRLVTIQNYRYRAGVALRDLLAIPTRGADDERDTWIARLLDERVFVGASLLVVLCILATLRASVTSGSVARRV